MIQQRDHLTFQNMEDTPESTHLNAPFVHKTKGLPVFYAPHPNSGLSLLNVALKLDFVLLPAFPPLVPERVGLRYPAQQLQLSCSFLRVPASFQFGSQLPSSAQTRALPLPPPHPPSPTSHQPLPDESSVKRNLHNYRDCALPVRHPVPENRV